MQKNGYSAIHHPSHKNAVNAVLAATLTLAPPPPEQFAAQYRTQIAQGLDPLLENEKTQNVLKAEHKKAKQREQQTVRSIFDEWKKRELQNRKDKGDEIERAFKKDVFPVMGSVHIGYITRADIKAVLDRPLARKGRRMANRLLSDIKQFIGFAIDEEYITTDPTHRLSKSKVGGLEKPRDRFLNEAERIEFAKALPLSGLHEKYQRSLWLILATGCRVGEISKMRWDEIDFKRATLFIPEDKAKNTKEHTIHLSDFALTHLKALKENADGDWVFTNRSGKNHIHKQTITKMVTDRQRKRLIKGRTQETQSLIIGKSKWTSHDLRRTAASIMQELRVPPDIVMKCINQSPHNALIETYQRAHLMEEQKKAFIALGEYLTQLYYHQHHL